MPPVIPPYQPSGRLTLAAIRNNLAVIAQVAATRASNPANVYPEWVLRTDLGKTVALLTVEATNRIHAWMVGSQKIETMTNQEGNFPFIGLGNAVGDRLVTFDMWGFWDYRIGDTATNLEPSLETAEKECEDIADLLKANGNNMFFDPKPVEIRHVRPLQINNIDVHAFSEGNDVVVAQCSIGVVIRR
jgi:hypothetical protein